MTATAVVEYEKFAPTRYNPPADLTFERWGQDVATASAMEKALPWWLGDLLNLGEAKWGERYTQAVSITGIASERLANYANIARKCSFRNEKLTWTHHKHVAPLEADEQRIWLELAEEEGWTSAELRDQIKADGTDSGDSSSVEVGERVAAGEFMGRPIRYEIVKADGLAVRGPEELLVALQNLVEG